MLWKKLVHPDEVVRAILADKSQITLCSPHALSNADRSRSNYLSVFLFRVQEREAFRQMNRSADAGRDLRLAVDLHYLVAPLTNSVHNDQLVFGRVLKLFHEIPVLEDSGTDLSGPLRPVDEPIRILRLSLSIPDQCALWRALAVPLHLAACYSVGPVFLS